MALHADFAHMTRHGTQTPANSLNLSVDSPLGVSCAPDALLQAALPALHGAKCPVFTLEKAAFRPNFARFPLLSNSASLGLLETIANAGSYRLRLEYTLQQLHALQRSTLHVALAESLATQLRYLAPPSVNTLLEVPYKVRPYAQKLYYLCELLACEDLGVDIALETLPDPWDLLERTFARSWPLFADCFEPWLVQLDRMAPAGAARHVMSAPPVASAATRSYSPEIVPVSSNAASSARMAPALGGGTAVAATTLWQHVGVYLPDMFVARGPHKFELVSSKVPCFVPLTFARMAVECLNCRYAIELSGSSAPTTSHTGSTGSPLDPFTDTSEKQWNFCPSPLDLQQEPADKQFAVYRLLARIVPSHSALNGEMRELVRPILLAHLNAVSSVFFLSNGTLWMLLREGLAGFAHRPSDAQLRPINEFISEHWPHKIYVGLQMNPDLINSDTDNLCIYYDPPRVLKMIFTRDVLARCNRVFSHLLRLQQENRRDPSGPSAVELLELTTRLNKRVLELERVVRGEFTFDSVLHASESVVNPDI